MIINVNDNPLPPSEGVAGNHPTKSLCASVCQFFTADPVDPLSISRFWYKLGYGIKVLSEDGKTSRYVSKKVFFQSIATSGNIDLKKVQENFKKVIKNNPGVFLKGIKLKKLEENILLEEIPIKEVAEEERSESNPKVQFKEEANYGWILIPNIEKPKKVFWVFKVFYKFFGNKVELEKSEECSYKERFFNLPLKLEEDFDLNTVQVVNSNSNGTIIKLPVKEGGHQVSVEELSINELPHKDSPSPPSCLKGTRLKNQESTRTEEIDQPEDLES